MRAIAIVILSLSLAAFSLGQKESSPVEGPEHFRWSEGNAHTLDYNHTIRSAVGLTPRQRDNLTQAVLRQLKRHKSLDEFFADMPAQKLLDLAANTRIERVDLNGDGTPEIIAQAVGLGPCGGTGNCIFWIFQMKSGGVKLLLDSLDSEAGFQVINIRPWSTNGFKDIVLGSHNSATDRNLVWYQYAGGAYRRQRCYHMSWPGDKDKSPSIAPANCADMFTPQK